MKTIEVRNDINEYIQIGTSYGKLQVEMGWYHEEEDVYCPIDDYALFESDQIDLIIKALEKVKEELKND